ncbi:MAG: glycine zipper 2TM domain-containing protein, partial [Sulfuricaulis sp.]|nr:glycine zipper 2TM domain-containing protein [Sulfuricaulis sp.]
AWVAAIALIVFSGVGIAAFMGWIPTSMGTSGNDAALDKSKAIPARAAYAKTPRTPLAAVKCVECGVIQSVREIETKGEGSGIGTVGGAVVGGVLGNQIGDGSDIATVVGAVGGAVAGNEIEKHVKSVKSYEITVRFDDGSTRVISEANVPAWRTGDKVKVTNGVIRSNA